MMSRKGMINRSQTLRLILTSASEGRTSPVGVIKDMILMPYIYALTTSLPGMFTITAKAPMIGIVSTAIPELELMKRENTI